MSESGVPVGTRLRCESCGTEIVVVKPSAGPISCCEESMKRAGGG